MASDRTRRVIPAVDYRSLSGKITKKKSSAVVKDASQISYEEFCRKVSAERSASGVTGSRAVGGSAQDVMSGEGTRRGKAVTWAAADLQYGENSSGRPKAVRKKRISTKLKTQCVRDSGKYRGKSGEKTGKSKSTGKIDKQSFDCVRKSSVSESVNSCQSDNHDSSFESYEQSFEYGNSDTNPGDCFVVDTDSIVDEELIPARKPVKSYPVLYPQVNTNLLSAKQVKRSVRPKSKGQQEFVSLTQELSEESEESEDNELTVLEKQLAIETTRNELLKLRKANETLEKECVVESKRNSNSNCNVNNIDYRSANLEGLRSQNQLVQEVEERMSNFGLFASQDSVCTSLPARVSSGENQANPSVGYQSYSKLVSGADDLVSASIKAKLMWPQTMLKSSFAGKKYKFLDLPSFQLLVAGECACLRSASMTEVERVARLDLLEETAYLASKVSWEVARDFHYNVMLAIERGEKSWGQSTLDIQTKLLLGAGGFSEKKTQGMGDAKASWKRQEPGKKWWCAEFQTGVCSLRSPHEGVIRGTRRMVEHFCASCMLKGKTIKYHSERDAECPFASARSLYSARNQSWGGRSAGPSLWQPSHYAPQWQGSQSQAYPWGGPVKRD